MNVFFNGFGLPLCPLHMVETNELNRVLTGNLFAQVAGQNELLSQIFDAALEYLRLGDVACVRNLTHALAEVIPP